MIDAALLLQVCFLFKTFFSMSEHQTEDPFPSLLVWMMSLITKWTCYHSSSKQNIKKDVGA